MKLGPLELQIKQQQDGSWRYKLIGELRGHAIYHYGYRPTEHQARDAGLEDAALIRQFC